MDKRYHTFTVLVASLNRSIRRIKSSVMAHYHLRSQHVSCIYYLYQNESLTASELCEICGEDKANLSRSLDYLEQNGYLVSRGKDQKRYKVPLELTPLGEEVGRGICERLADVLEKSSRGMSEADRETMYASLAIIDENLKKIQGEYNG